MKKHAIIPIFIAHRGCPNQCVFCNQRAITHRTGDITVDGARTIIEEWLQTLDAKNTEIEISFFGGSFTGIPMEDQSAFLSLAKEYKDSGKVKKIHCSTRPDYINREILDNLKAFGMDTIELGVQSFDEDVLHLSKRGHSAEAVFEASRLIKEYGFELGIQLMIGLPGDTKEKCMESVKKTIEIAPSIARLYPTVVLPDTELFDMKSRGEYSSIPEDEMIDIVKDMYMALTGAGINVIRIGLKSNDLIQGDTYHPAFGQLVKSRIVCDEIDKLIQAEKEQSAEEKKKITILVPKSKINEAFGHKGENLKYFANKYPSIDLKIVSADVDIISLKTAFVSENSRLELREYLEKEGYVLRLVKNAKKMTSPVAAHPDVHMCKLRDRIYFGDEDALLDKYPRDVLYNAAAVGDYIICSKYTSEDLIKASGMKPIFVPQGYVKCNMVVVDDKHVITEDEGIPQHNGRVPRSAQERDIT